jgi:DNA (cytosine-5)-methyltransferase 1
LLPLARPIPLDGIRADAREFLIRAEDHGVPQARHRVIILGIRSDLAVNLPAGLSPLGRPQKSVSIQEAICGLWSLRSGLSGKDNTGAWQNIVREQAARISVAEDVPEEVRAIAQSIKMANDLPQLRQSSWRGETVGMPDHLRTWFDDPKLTRTLHHETRSHIPDDIGRYMFSAAWTHAFRRAPKLEQFPTFLQPDHRNRASGAFADRFRTQAADRPSTTVTSHISKDGHYFIHPDPKQSRSLTVREAARLQTFPDNYFFCGPRTKQYHQVGNAVPPYLAYQIGWAVLQLLK